MSKVEFVGTTKMKVIITIEWDGQSEPELTIDGAHFKGDADTATDADCLDAVIHRLSEWADEYREKHSTRTIIGDNKA